MNRTEKIIFGAGALCACTALFFLNPTQHDFMPRCLWKSMMGYDCPGCGFQRALHAALRGRLLEAAHYNLFLILVIPYLIALIMSDWILTGERAARWQRVTHSQWMLWGYVVLYFLWWILRNVMGI